jgi:CRP/FNR family transcriptional regulator, cyclic AMP receptor protein
MKQETSVLRPVDKVLCLQTVDVFRHATTEMLAFIGSIAKETVVMAGRPIFEEEDVSDAMYVVVEGHVQLEKSGSEVMTVGAGQSFGTWALFDNEPRVMTARALSDVLLLKIRSADFYDLLSDHEEITPVMFRAVIKRVKTLIPD